MQYRILGKTGISVSPICIGAWQLAGPLFFNGKPDGHPDPGKDAVLRMIRTLGGLGVNCIDTAEQYGNGESERRVGAAVKGERDRWVISTKFGYRVGPNQTREDDSSPPTILPSLEGSLKRLDTDYVDIYLYHCPPKFEHLAEARAVLEQARQQGKLRFYGISTNHLPLIQALIDQDMLHVLQYHTNLLQDAPAIRALAAANNVGTQVRGVMAEGRLSGKYFHGTPAWRADDRRSATHRDHDFQRYASFEQALPEGYTMAQVAIRWILDDPGQHTICLGATKLEDYRPALQAADLPPLTPATREKLAACAAELAAE